MSLKEKFRRLLKNITKREDITMFTLVDVYMGEHDAQNEEELEMNAKESYEGSLLRKLGKAF